MTSLPETSLAAVFHAPGRPFELAHVPLPILEPGEAIVKVECCTICGSDLHSIAGRRNVPAPTILGHEIVGTVAQVGPGHRARALDGEPIQPGDRIAWSVAAFFLGMSGAIFGNLTGFVEPLEVAFPAATFGIFMVVMALLGGKGTLWGPVIGATLFHIVKEVTWTYLLGWQWVALGLLIVVNVVFFQEGIMGWMQRKWPERFGITVDQRMSAEGGQEGAR